MQPQKNLFFIRDWSGFVSKFGAKMILTMENKATASIAKVRNKTDFLIWVFWGCLTLYIKIITKTE